MCDQLVETELRMSAASLASEALCAIRRYTTSPFTIYLKHLLGTPVVTDLVRDFEYLGGDYQRFRRERTYAKQSAYPPVS